MKAPRELVEKRSRFFRWLKLALMAAPLSIIMHEFGHALNAVSVGYSGIYITYHSWGGLAPFNIEPFERAWISAGGPIASLLIVVVCHLLVRSRPTRDFLKTLGMMAPIQFTGALIYVLGSVLRLNASTVFDSARVAHYLGESIFVTSIPGSVVLLTSWTVFIRSIDAVNRKEAVSGIVVGGVIGFFVWLSIIGPIVLPD